jgi:hypothetical protein
MRFPQDLHLQRKKFHFFPCAVRGCPTYSTSDANNMALTIVRCNVLVLPVSVFPGHMTFKTGIDLKA